MTGDAETSTPKTDPLNPYYLGSHDVLSAKISNIILRRDNYDAWQRSMTFSLKARRKFGFVDGTIKKPTDAFELDNWVVVNCTLIQWIRNTIDPALLDNISYPDDASVLWSEIKSQYAVVDGTMIHNLKTQLHQCVQTKGMDVTTYFGKLKTLWDSIAKHEPPLACRCGKCECNIGTAALQRQDNERLHQFFMGLYRTLYVAIFATPPANSDWRALRDKERAQRNTLFCSFCETRGHEASKCFFKSMRFPDWWGDRPRTLADYKRYRTRQARGSNSSNDGGSGSSATTGSNTPAASVHANAVLTSASAHSLLSSDRLSGMYNWIIDTGASNHVTGTLSFLMNQTQIPGRTVGLPNGQQVESTDPSSRKTIGAGELRDGLFWIQAGETPLAVNSVSGKETFELWHKRLGHPSHKVVKTIPSFNSLISNKDTICDACHLAKQHRDSFDLNYKRASDFFELIHCDLWGPYRLASSCGAKYFFNHFG
ncbi:uncharacterized protein LOC141595061 [Silene latifolia]|uniref:uncharacterized protein LOC141595061 n=1 Tax=Silene latifolia TaxID=37657 RepID=UPI003D783390